MSVASPPAARNDVQVVRLAEPSREPESWLALGLVLLLLAAVALLVRWRSRQPPTRSPPRPLRILAAAAAFAGALTLLLIVEAIWNGFSAEWVAARTVIAFAALLVVGLILCGIADFWLCLFRPHRSRRWLAIAVVSFVLCVAAYLLIVALIDGNWPDLALSEMLQLGLVALVTAAAWWAYLPPAREDVSQVFD